MLQQTNAVEHRYVKPTMTQHVVREASADDATALADLYADSLVDAYAGVALPESVVEVDKVDRTARFRSTIADGSRLWLVGA